ncbi:hypothetical protein FAES_0551 [Fibrella aestuarina BUZ 2]|uniref:Uncharacterized protein n=1 Tax=Fibrella aestuarina BUZ 2 TaxID=1166018 RepID=I0K359_9BACT|nr:hypothetical protein FAES_0551 [Fibrella aestuarina BUZ 2]
MDKGNAATHFGGPNLSAWVAFLIGWLNLCEQ